MTTGTVIARGGLPLRKTPKAGAVLSKLRRNTRVDVLEKETWLRVRTRDGSVGYVLADFVEVAPQDLFPTPEPQPAARAATTRRRAAPVARAETPRGPAAAAPQPSPACEIRIYRNDRFTGNELRADTDFFTSLDRLNQFAAACGVEIFVTSSTREPGRSVAGAIVPPATRSNHLIGHAIDMNVRFDGRLFDSAALKRDNLPNLPAAVREFIESVRADATLRWGGDFNPEDPVHFDDGLNRRDPALWDSKLASRG
jgi:hypothetical protein